MRIRLFLSISASLLLCGNSAIAAPAGETQVPNVAPVSSESCEHLASLELSNASITMAKAVPAGTFVGPPEEFTGRDLSAFYKKLPAFCRVVVHAKPSSDSDIVVELWMPLSGWNGKLEGLGNGGFAGQIDYEGLGAAIIHGFAAVATDTGHAGSPIDASWALGHPEKVVRLWTSRHSRDDPRGQARCPAVLWIRTEALVLYWVLRWRPGSPDGSPALSRRLRWHPCRRACQLLDRPAFNRGRRYCRH